MPADDLLDHAVGYAAGVECVDEDRCGLGHADRIGELNLYFVRIACCHEVLGYISCCIGCASVNLGAVLSGESAAAVARHSAVSVDDDLAAGEACVAGRSADHESACRIDEELGVLIDHIRRKDLVKDILLDVSVDLLLIRIVRVLRGENNRLKSAGLSVLIVLHGDLCLSVGSEIRERSVLSDFRELSGQLVRQVDRIRHIAFALIGSISEHHALVARTDRLELLIGHFVLLCLKGAVHAHRDIRGLLVKTHNDLAGIRVESESRIRVADFPNRFSCDLLVVDCGARRDLSADQDETRAGSCLAGHPAARILRHARVEDRVGDRITHLIGMSFCN